VLVTVLNLKKLEKLTFTIPTKIRQKYTEIPFSGFVSVMSATCRCMDGLVDFFATLGTAVAVASCSDCLISNSNTHEPLGNLIVYIALISIDREEILSKDDVNQSRRDLLSVM